MGREKECCVGSGAGAWGWRVRRGRGCWGRGRWRRSRGRGRAARAATGKVGYPGDGGPASEAGMSEPNGICLDGKGSLYIADVRGQRVRRVRLDTGVITTAAGTGERKDAGDGGLATAAAVNGPRA